MVQDSTGNHIFTNKYIGINKRGIFRNRFLKRKYLFKKILLEFEFPQEVIEVQVEFFTK